MKFDVPKDVINILFSAGYEDQIIDTVMACEGMPDTSVSDIPLSPTQMQDSRDHIIISPNVYQTYLQFLQRINNSETAKEIPFFLLGNRKEIDGTQYVVFEEIVYDMKEALSDTRVSANIDSFQQLLADDNFSIVSIGHTHGNVSENQKNVALARKLPMALKDKYDIRDTGLNVSVSDIWQYEAFKALAKNNAPNKEIFQTVIMYNGDMVILGSDGITKTNDVVALTENNEKIAIKTGMGSQTFGEHIK